MTKNSRVFRSREEEIMVFLGAVLLGIVGILLVVASRRGAPAAQIFIMAATALVFIPVALFGVLVMGFSDGTEDTRTGVILLVGSVIAGGGITIGCISRMKKTSVTRE